MDVFTLIAINLPSALGVPMTYIAQLIKNDTHEFVLKNVAKIVLSQVHPNMPPQVMWQAEPAFDAIDEEVTLPKVCCGLYRVLNKEKDEKLYMSHEKYMTQLRAAKSGIVTAKTMPPEKKLIID